MSAAPQTTPFADSAVSSGQLGPSLRSAAAAALVAFGLSFPILSYHAESNINNELVLVGRWPLSLGLATIVFIFVFLRQMARADWRMWFDPFVSSVACRIGCPLLQAHGEG